MERMDKELTPNEYFLKLKGEIEVMDANKLKTNFDNICHLAEKYKKTGQIKSLNKLKFLTEVMKKEEVLIDLGVNKFIYRNVIEDYIENVSKEVVKIQDLKNFTREIPDEIVEVICKTKNIFNKFYVIFTDYTGLEERKVELERREKDPIIFGVFTEDMHVSDRFYYLGDWEDEYCDLTLDKLVSEYKKQKGISPYVEVKRPETIDELIGELSKYTEETEDTNGQQHFNIDLSNVNSIESNINSGKFNLFKKVKSIFGKKI